MKSVLRRKKLSVKQCLLFVVLVIGTSGVFAQTPSAAASSKEDAPIFCPIVMISVSVRVTDKNGTEIKSLRHTDFVIYEDGVQQEIAVFRMLEENDPKSQQGRYIISYSPTNDTLEKDQRNIRVVLKARHKRNLKVKFFPTSYSAVEAYSRIKD